MREGAARRFRKTANKARLGFMGERVTLRWLGAHSGEYSSLRDEYVPESGEVELSMEDVPCLVALISERDMQYGEWGEVEVGDLIVGVSPDIDTSGMQDLRVIYGGDAYEVIPNSSIAGTMLGGVVGGKAINKVLQCRYTGENKWHAQQ